jgi:hypothetical protein
MEERSELGFEKLLVYQRAKAYVLLIVCGKCVTLIY